MRVQALLVVLAVVSVARANGQSTAGTCPPRDTVYSLVPADTARGFQWASPAVIQTPPPEFRGMAEVRMLVTAEGRVLAESTTVLGASAGDSSVLARAVRAFRFHPAAWHGCSISSWFSMKFRR